MYVSYNVYNVWSAIVYIVCVCVLKCRTNKKL